MQQGTSHTTFLKYMTHTVHKYRATKTNTNPINQQFN